jgi:hypothetical protein
MALFSSRLAKAPGAVRTAFESVLGKIRNTIETTEVYNPDPAKTYPIGTVMSYVSTVGVSVDLKGQVAPTTHQALPPETSCKGQYAVVLESALAVGTAAGPAVATGRHGGGPVYVRLDTGLDLHVGDALWSSGIRGIATNVPEATAIYIGMVDSIVGYVPADPAGDSGCMAILKHDVFVERGV